MINPKRIMRGQFRPCKSSMDDPLFCLLLKTLVDGRCTLHLTSLHPNKKGPVRGGPGILDSNFKQTGDSGFKFQKGQDSGFIFQNGLDSGFKLQIGGIRYSDLGLQGPNKTPFVYL